MDAGIISAFKAHYKRLYLRQVIRDFESGVDEPAKINVLQAIHLTKAAWEEITTETIKNCWRHTEILPAEHLARLFPGQPARYEHDNNEGNNQYEERLVLPEVLAAEREIEDAVQNGLANDAALQDLAQQYLGQDDPLEIEEALDDRQIVELAQNPDAETHQKEDNADFDEPEPVISLETAKKYLNEVLKLVNVHPQQPVGFVKESDAANIRDLLSRTHKAAINAMKQSTIDGFFRNANEN
jgi:hypothetical protein